MVLTIKKRMISMGNNMYPFGVQYMVYVYDIEIVV